MPTNTRRDDDGGRLGDGDGDGVDLDELTMLALAADPDVEADPDAEPFGGVPSGVSLLPEWYMPMPASMRRTRSRVVMVSVIIAALVVVNGAGLCVTYGLPEIAW